MCVPLNGACAFKLRHSIECLKLCEGYGAMFSRKDQLLKKTGPDGIGRYDFLRLLKKEFEETKSEDAQNQTLANLANFAYDPINYDYIRSLHLIDLFLELLNSNNNTHVDFSIAALCNLSSDPANKHIIIQKQGLSLISKLLYSDNEESMLNAITTLIFLNSHEIDYPTKSVIVIKLKELQKSKNTRISNLANIYFKNSLINN